MVNRLIARGRRVWRRAADGARWHGEIRTVLRGPGAGLLIRSELGSANYAEGINELPVQQAITGVLQSGACFYDIGANVGFFSLLAARSVGPSGRVIAFEPVPGIARTLQANVQLNRFANIEVLTTAVGAESGHVPLHVTRHPGGATIVASVPTDEVAEVVETEVVTIDALLATGRVNTPPDVVKIDVEGNELDCLLGMGDTISTHHPVLLIELDDASAEAVATKRTAVERLLESAGYSTEVLPPAYPGTDWHVIHLLARWSSCDG